MKIYLIGYLYDDFSTEGFEILKIASTEERAQTLLRFLQNTNPNGPDNMGYEIREWEVDNANPVGDIVHHTCCYGGIDFVMDTVLPYKIIKNKEDK